MEIETERLVLRPHGLEHAEALYALFSHPGVLRFLAVGSLSREDCWNRLLRYAGHWALFGYGMFAAFDRRDGRFIGEAGLADFHRGLGPRFDGRPEAAWIFHPDHHGQGFATEAVAAVHRWIDERLHGPATVCIINPQNAPSLRVATRQGYAEFDRVPYKGVTYAMLERPAAQQARPLA